MKISALATCFLGLLMSGSAYAADVGAPAYDWSGAYIGAQVGGSWGNVDQIIPAYGPLPDGDVSGLVAGGYVGYRAQLDSIVLGVELGGNWRHVNGENDVLNAPEMLETRQNWDASAVAQLGVPMDAMLLYALGGVTASGIEARYTNTTGNSPWTGDTEWGWTVGAGIEAALTESLHARIEYRYADYGTTDATCAACGPTKVDLSTHTVMAGLSYHF